MMKYEQHSPALSVNAFYGGSNVKWTDKVGATVHVPGTSAQLRSCFQ